MNSKVESSARNHLQWSVYVPEYTGLTYRPTNLEVLSHKFQERFSYSINKVLFLNTSNTYIGYTSFNSQVLYSTYTALFSTQDDFLSFEIHLKISKLKQSLVYPFFMYCLVPIHFFAALL